MHRPFPDLDMEHDVAGYGILHNSVDIKKLALKSLLKRRQARRRWLQAQY